MVDDCFKGLYPNMGWHLSIKFFCNCILLYHYELRGSCYFVRNSVGIKCNEIGVGSVSSESWAQFMNCIILIVKCVIVSFCRLTGSI